MKYLIVIYTFFLSITTYGQITNLNYHLKASDGIYSNKVHLQWDHIPKADFYTISRSYNTPFQITKRGKKEPVDVLILKDLYHKTSYIDYSIPFGQYKYIITAYKTNIAPKKETKREIRKRKRLSRKTKNIIPIPIETNIIPISTLEDFGHRTVSDKEFFLEFQKGIDSSLPRIRTMKMLNFFGEKEEGLSNGQLIYKTTGIIRKPFRVMISYSNFIDQSLSLNGTYEVQIFRLFAQEGKLVGTFQVKGIYNGTVTHNLIIDRGQSIGGTYEVQQTNGTITSLPWDIASHPLDDTLYEESLKHSIKESQK